MKALAICFVCAFCVGVQAETEYQFDPEEMANARAKLNSTHGGQTHSLILGERLEHHSNDGDSLVVWEGQGWIGGDIEKFWVKTEGEYESAEGKFEEFEIQALYSRAVLPFWDLQAGIRHDIKPDPSRTYLAIGAQGLAPQWFELDATLFVSDQGDVSARFEAEYDVRLTQRLIIQPRIELNASLSEDRGIRTGSGLSTAEAGVRLRYEIKREFAPYLGVSWTNTYGNTKNFAQEDGEVVRQLSWIGGIRFWF